jgi:hypothetical protein
VRNYAQQHPSITYIEFSLEDDDLVVGKYLENIIGIPSKCWGRSNYNDDGRFDKK